MTDRRFVDFDQAWAEQAADAPGFRAFGRDFTLPKSPPVKLTLIAMRAAQGGDPSAQIAPEQLLDVASMLIGRDTVKQLLDEGLEFDQLGDIVKFAQSAYADMGHGDGEDPPAGEAEQGQALPSSPTGDTSKPTSSASTDWIS